MSIITLENVNKSYESNSVLKNVSLKIEYGDIFGIVGLSGAGKSTLIRTINGLEKINSGNIIVDKTNIIKLKGAELAKLRQKIGFIFQNFCLMTNSTVFENISFPLKVAKFSKQEIKKRVNELLKIVELEDKIDNYPSQLSGGQKQRVAIARALALKPKIMLCDEATSALDPKTTRSILALLKDINKTTGITIVLVTHDMNVVKEICKNIAVMEKGVIVETGETKEIFANTSSILKHFLEEEA